MSLQSDNVTTTDPALKRSLGVFSGIGLLVGITIGSGIYSTPSIIAGYFPSFTTVIIAWVSVGAFVLIGGAVYAELGTRMPSTGGEYMYISRSFGRFAGFMFGWAQLFIIRTSPAAGLAIIAADYVGYFVPMSSVAHMSVALSIIALLGVLNVVGVKKSAAFLNVTTSIKVVGLVLFATVGVWLLSGISSELGSVSPPTRALGPAGNLVAALMLIVFSHTGWDRLGYVAGEYRNPRHAIPRAMVIGLSIIIVIYWATNTIYHYALGMEGIRATATPAAAVADLMVGTVGAALVALLAIISAVGSINGTMMASSRVYYAMARDGLFFKGLNYVHPTFGTPSRAIIVHCIWAGVILIARGSFENIAAGMVFAILIFYTLTTLSLFKMRREERIEEQRKEASGNGQRNEEAGRERHGEAGRERPGEAVGREHDDRQRGDTNGEDRDRADIYRMPFYPVLPAIYLMGIVGLLVARIIFEPEKSAIDFMFVATGLPVSYFWLRKGKRKGRRLD